jgi:hypothetical protein
MEDVKSLNDLDFEEEDDSIYSSSDGYDEEGD